MEEKNKALNKEDESISSENINLIKAYIGKNSDKILKNELNIPTILIGAFYLDYRKMTGYAIAALMIKLVMIYCLLIYLPVRDIRLNCVCIIDCLIFNIILMLISNKLYLKFVKTKIDELIRKNPQITYQELKTLCSNKGGTGGGGLMVVIAILFLIYITVVPSVKKPMIYIYPKEKMNVSVKLSDSRNITVSYPEYKNMWNVTAYPDGTLVKDGNKYYGLYYEAKWKNRNDLKEGFVVNSDDVEKFLEEKLTYLGLNYKEREEFIVYWLPKLKESKYNYIYFETMDEINQKMKLDIEPKPDTLIRIIMDYKPLNRKINIKEEKLTKVERNGYTVVEWGGTRLN